MNRVNIHGQVDGSQKEEMRFRLNPYASSSDICYVYISVTGGDMWKPRKCHCTILVEFKSPKGKNSLGQMGIDLFTKGRGWDWISYDPWVQPGFTSKTTMEANSIPWLVSDSLLQHEFSFENNLCKQPILCVDHYLSCSKATTIGN